MASIPLHYLDLRTFAYVTEDEGQVETALRTLLPEDYPIDRERTEGHYGDPILVLSSRVERADDQRYVLQQLSTEDVAETLAAALTERITDNCELYLRVDKQAAYNGRVEPGQGITIRGKVEAYPANRENAIESGKEILEHIEATT